MKKLLQLGCLLLLLAAGARAQERIVLPLEKLPNGLLLVEVRVNGKPARLVVDTASEMTVLDNDLLGMSAREIERAIGVRRGGPPQDGVRPSVILRATLTLGTFSLADQRVAVSELDGVSRTLGRRIDGILGVDLLGKFAAVTIRWRARELVLQLEEKP